MINSKDSVRKTEGYVYPTSFKKVLKDFNLNAKDILKLDYNEPTIQPSPKVRQALINYIKNGKLEWYPGGDCNEVRTELAKYTGVNQNEIIVGNGSDEILKVIANTFLSEGNEIIVPVPNYSMFIINSELIGAKIIKIPCEITIKANEIINKTTKRTKIIYMSNPNSPLGYINNKKEIIKLLKKAKDIVIIIDEAYFEFSKETCVNLINEYPNLIIIRTLSKAFSLASFRIGYGISNKNIISELNKVKDPESVNTLAQIAAIEALKDKNYTNNFIKEIQKSKLYLEKNLKKLGLKVWPSKSNFLFVTFPEMYNAKQIWKNLEKKGIFLRERTKVIQNSLRVGIPRLNESKKLVKKIKKELRPLLIFDIDGVLVNVSNSYRETIKKTVKKLINEDITDLNIQDLKNKSGFNNDWDLTKELIRKKGYNIKKKKIINIFQDFYIGNQNKKGLINNEKWLMNKNILKNLSKKYTLSILTGRPKKEAEYTLKKNKVIKYFSKIIALEDVKKSKPNPEGINKIIKEFQNNRAFYFGDVVDDMRTAISANIIPIGILRPNAQKNEKLLLTKAGAKIVLNNINQIQEILK